MFFCVFGGMHSHAIQNLLFDFESEVWYREISEDAKDFIRSILVFNPKNRPTATEVHDFSFNPFPLLLARVCIVSVDGTALS